MIGKIFRRLVFLIVAAILIALITLLVVSRITGTNQFDILQAGLENIINPQKQEAPKEVSPIEVEYTDSNLQTLQNSATFTLKVKSELKPSSVAKYEFYLSQKPKADDSFYWYVVKINNIGVGDFNQKVLLEDVNTAAGDISISGSRQAFNLPLGLSEISDWENFAYTANGDSLLALVDKQNKLPLDYAPINLVDVNKDLLLYTNSSEPILITTEAGDALKIMADEAQSQLNKNLVITSGYRSYNEQYRTYAGWVRQLGQEEADKVSARPGFSEHQLGTVVDFVDQDTGFDLTNDFESGALGRWLMENAYKYGYIQSYPSGKESETGYLHEAWHWRYIGVQNAKEYKESGLTLNQWLNQKRNS